MSNNDNGILDTNPQNSESIVRKNILTRKEKKLKNLLFKKSRRPRRAKPSNQENTPGPTPDNPQPANLAVMPEEVTKNINGFMNEMTDFIKKADNEQISRQMLHDQNSLLKEHARVLELNQDTLKTMMKEQKRKKNQEDYNSQKLVIIEMMKPFLGQVKEIRELFDQSKEQALEVNRCLKRIKKEKKYDPDEVNQEKKFDGVFEGYVGNQNKLRRKFDKAEKLADFYKKKFKDLENFGVDRYMKDLRRFNSELNELENRSKQAQDEVEKRIHNINKRYNLMLPATYVDLIEKNVKLIDFDDSKKKISKKLGGDLDYKNFKLDLEDIMDELQLVKDEFDINKKKTEILVPEKLDTNFAEDYIKRIEESPSILDEVKEKIKQFKESLPVYEQRVNQKTSTPHSTKKDLIWNRHSSKPQGGNIPTVRKGKKRRPVSYRKPDYLRDIRSKPIACKADVRFRKLQPGADDYLTMFDLPEDHDLVDLKKQMGETDYDNWLKENPEVTKRKGVRLHYRPMKDEKIQTQKDIAVDTFSFQESNMATDAFLKAFGRKSDSSVANNINNNNQLKEVVRESIKNLRRKQKKLGYDVEEDENPDLDPEYRKSGNIIHEEVKDVQNLTKKMIIDPEDVNFEPGVRMVVKNSLALNLDTMVKHFKKKDPPPFKNYDPPQNLYEEPPEIQIRRKGLRSSSSKGLISKKDYSELQESSRSKKPKGKFEREKDIDDLADNIVSILNKALGKAAESPNLISIPHQAPRYQNVDPSLLKSGRTESKKITPAISPRKDPGVEANLSRLYNNIAAINHAPRYENQTQETDQSMSIADDLSQYLNQMRETLDKNQTAVEDVEGIEDSEGEIKFGNFRDKQWLDGDDLGAPELGDNDVGGEKDITVGDRSSGEVSFNHFSVDVDD